MTDGTDETQLDEPIVVEAVFDNSRLVCRPTKFTRPSGKEVTITEIGLRHPSRRGSKTLHIFDVTDGEADYRLEFDSVTLHWRLTRQADTYEV